MEANEIAFVRKHERINEKLIANLEFNHREVKSLLVKIPRAYLNNGYPFAAVQLTTTEITISVTASDDTGIKDIIVYLTGQKITKKITWTGGTFGEKEGTWTATLPIEPKQESNSTFLKDPSRVFFIFNFYRLYRLSTLYYIYELRKN